MSKTAQEASLELEVFRKLLLEDKSDSEFDTGCLLAKAIQLFSEIEQVKDDNYNKYQLLITHLGFLL